MAAHSLAVQANLADSASAIYLSSELNGRRLGDVARFRQQCRGSIQRILPPGLLQLPNQFR
jgi:hypothetical protein